MVSRKKRARVSSSPIVEFEFLKGINQPELKNVYSSLVKLSPNAQRIRELSNVLFRELEEKFETLFSKLSGVSAANDIRESGSSLDLSNSVEVVNSLFRCCLLLLYLLAPQQRLLFEKGPVLLKIIRKLMLPNLIKNTGRHAFVFEESVNRKCAPQDNGCSTSSVEGFSASIEFFEPCNPLLHFKCTMLEVFIDELLARKQLAGYLKMINSVAGMCDRLFKPQSAQAHARILMEVICNHFILSYSDKNAFGGFVSRLFCLHSMKNEYPFSPPALGITAAVLLFLNPIMASAPKYIQAHLFSLVSEAVHIKNLKPDHKHTNCFLSIFEKSVVLYMRHIPCLKTDDFSINTSHDFVYQPLRFYISSETLDKVDTLISRLYSSSNDVLDGIFSGMKSDLVSTSLRFVKDCQTAFTISCQEEIFAILCCLVLKASESYNDKEIRPVESATLQQLYLLTPLLKLMSISLLQAIQCVRHSDVLSCSRSLKDFSSCEEYDIILSTIACFEDLDISLPLQQFVCSGMSSHPMRHKDSKMIFLHFLGLMSLSFATGLECLVKACLLTMFALLNLFVFEEGDLDALHSLINSGGESFSSGSSVRFQETVSNQSSSLVVASRFNKIRSLHSRGVENKHNENEILRITSGSASHMDVADCLEEETEETCNGEILLKCLLKGNASGCDDLVDFIECEPGEDYSHWLKSRQRFRKWRYEKMAVLKWKRRKKSRKTINGRRYH